MRVTRFVMGNEERQTRYVRWRWSGCTTSEKLSFVAIFGVGWKSQLALAMSQVL